jgi:hypothetical protein
MFPVAPCAADKGLENELNKVITSIKAQIKKTIYTKSQKINN